MARYPKALGFKSSTSGTHTSRTIMLEELTLLLSRMDIKASHEDYVHAIVEDNILGKATTSTRRLSAQRLTELYALDINIPIFRTLLRLWPLDPKAQPLLALLCALARDPLLRCTASVIIRRQEGQSFDRNAFASALKLHAGTRLNDSTIDKVVRNTAASWTQAGHLVGRTLKQHARVSPTPIAVTMALLLGYLQGLRGPELFRTLWCEVLDSTPESLINLASRASMTGYLRFRYANDAMEIAFPDLLTQADLERITYAE